MHIKYIYDHNVINFVFPPALTKLIVLLAAAVDSVRPSFIRIDGTIMTREREREKEREWKKYSLLG
jgi:hypothetical protein